MSAVISRFVFARELAAELGFVRLNGLDKVLVTLVTLVSIGSLLVVSRDVRMNLALVLWDPGAHFNAARPYQLVEPTLVAPVVATRKGQTRSRRGILQ